MKVFCLLLILSHISYAMDGDKENKLQEEALILNLDNGKDSPEVEEFLQKNELKEDEMDYFTEEKVEN